MSDMIVMNRKLLHRGGKLIAMVLPAKCSFFYEKKYVKNGNIVYNFFIIYVLTNRHYIVIFNVEQIKQ